MARFRFQELEVWQQAIQFADLIYEQTGRFPSEEKFGLSSQLRRAAVSISSNIAEGNGRPSNTEYARFVEIAYSSLMEVVSQLHIAQLRNYLTQADLDHLNDRAERIARMLSGLRNSLRRSSSP